MLVTVVKCQRLENALMQSCTVKTHCNAAEDVLLKILFIGIRVDSVGIKALVEDKSEEALLSVQHQLSAVAVGHLSHAEIAFHLVLP